MLMYVGKHVHTMYKDFCWYSVFSFENLVFLFTYLCSVMLCGSVVLYGSIIISLMSGLCVQGKREWDVEQWRDVCYQLFLLFFQSIRWKVLLSFNCRNRLLLTGTPIQNTMQEVCMIRSFDF